MKNHKKLMIIFIILLISAFAITFIIINQKSQAPINYIANKYDLQVDSIKLCWYTPKLLKNDSSTTPMPWFEFFYTPQRWKFKYNDRVFYVDCVNDRYFDDYQLEDLSKWCTKYLQENIDENIVGFETDSSNLYDISADDNNYIFDTPLEESDAQVYIETQCVIAYVLYNDKSFSPDNFDEEIKSNELKEKLNDLGINTRTILIKFTNGKDIKFKKVQRSNYKGYKYTVYTFT